MCRFSTYNITQVIIKTIPDTITVNHLPESDIFGVITHKYISTIDKVLHISNANISRLLIGL